MKVKYWYSDEQSGHGMDVNYVLVEGEWVPYSEITHEESNSNWEDAILVVESDHELPIQVVPMGEESLFRLKKSIEKEEKKKEL